jgi:hypothetical protein
MAQIPRAEPGKVCPYHKQDMSKVCHTCPMWRLYNVSGADGKRRDHWDCSLALGTPLTAENTGVTAEAAVATQRLRNLTFELAKIQVAAEYHDKPDTLAAVMNAFKLLEAKDMALALAAPEAL